jgi:hypothetical protein
VAGFLFDFADLVMHAAARMAGSSSDRHRAKFAAAVKVWIWPILRLRDHTRELTVEVSARLADFCFGQTGATSARGQFLTDARS